MKYIVFEYVGKGALYLVPENDKQELQLLEEYQKDYPGNAQQIGVLESNLEMGSHWWNIGRRPEKQRPVNRIRNRNADYL